jgi:hypothetical protein
VCCGEHFQEVIFEQPGLYYGFSRIALRKDNEWLNSPNDEGQLQWIFTPELGFKEVIGNVCFRPVYFPVCFAASR